jgi:hypothetical protein
MYISQKDKSILKYFSISIVLSLIFYYFFAHFAFEVFCNKIGGFFECAGRVLYFPGALIFGIASIMYWVRLLGTIFKKPLPILQTPIETQTLKTKVFFILKAVLFIVFIYYVWFLIFNYGFWRYNTI